MISPADFWARVERNGPIVRSELGRCWIWTGRRDRGGYGALGKLRAHRVAWEIANGPIPSSDNWHGTMLVCHRCDNPPCCNPDHLFLGTNADNTADRNAKGRQARGERTRPETRARGERNGQSLLTEPIVRAIVADHALGLTQRTIAAKHGIAQTTVSAVLRGRIWKHVPRPIVSVGRGNYATNGEHQRKRASGGAA